MTKKYYEQHKEVINKRRRERYKNDPIYHRKKDEERKKFRRENPEWVKEQRRKYFLKHREKFAKRARQWVLDNPDKAKKYRQKFNLKIKNILFDHYGRICKCCGETEIKFLSIDHINNDGYKERKRLPGRVQQGGNSIYSKIIKKGFPDTYQVLCMNCNFGKAQNGGICPHKMKGKSEWMA